MSNERICAACGHSLTDNLHGPDQNDYEWHGEELVHTGRCTYCAECNPRLKKLLEEA